MRRGGKIKIFQQRPPGAAPLGAAAQAAAAHVASAASGADGLLGDIAPGGEDGESPAVSSEFPLEERLAKLDALFEKGLNPEAVRNERKLEVLESAGC